LIRIETDRLVIRESSGRDFSRIYAMMLSADEKETTDTVSASEDTELEKFLAYIHTAYKVFGFGLWSVCLKDVPDSVIGRCGLQAVADGESLMGRIELGYLIDAPYRRQGYGYEACRAIVDYAFLRLELDELFVHIAPGNRASAHLAEKLGFQKPPSGELWRLENPYGD
jgi:RimJ/RimL family protein N-acetyltransferase